MKKQKAQRTESPRNLIYRAVWRLHFCLPVLYSIFILLIFSGCWSSREVDSLAIVLGTGVDVGSMPDTVDVTSQIVKVNELKSSTQSSDMQMSQPSKKAYLNIRMTGKDVFSAIWGISHISSRNVYYGHNQLAVFSSEIAKRGITKELDVIIRGFESRMNIYVLISRGRAYEIFDEEPDLEKLPAKHIADMMRDQILTSETVIVTVRDFAIATLSGSTAPVAPFIELYKTVEGKMKVKLEGTAIFKQGKLIGELDKAQTKGLLWVTGKTKRRVSSLETKQGRVNLKIDHTESKLKPVKQKDGSFKMVLKLSEDCFINSNETMSDMSSAEQIEMLKKLEHDTILKDINKAYTAAGSISADIFGFGEAIRGSYPKDWDKLKDKWDEVFPTIELDIHAEVIIRSTGGLNKPVVPGGAA